MASLNKEINKFLEPHELFYAKVQDNTYALFMYEEDLDNYVSSHHIDGTVHRTGIKTKTAFLNYLNGVDLYWVVLKIKQAKKEQDEQNKFVLVVNVKGDTETRSFGFPTAEDRQACIDDLKKDGVYEWLVGDPIEE